MQARLVKSEVRGVPEQLIWFLHFHKAGGTTVVELAQKNGERLFTPHANGAPLGDDGKPIDVSMMSSDELAKFVDACKASRISFVASEFHTPDLDYLAGRGDVRLITVVRDPLARYISNFDFDRYFDFNNARRLADYAQGSTRAMCRPNYYCNTLLGRHESPRPLTEADLQEAQRRLALFDLVIHLGEKCAFARLDTIGWHITEMQANSMKPDLRNAFGAWRNPPLVLRRLFFRKTKVTDAFREHFEKDNWADQALLQSVGHN